MKHFGIALLLLCSIGLASATAATPVLVSRIAAVVNKDIITTYQLDQKLQEQLAKKEEQPSPAQLGALRQELLSRMIEEKLVEQRIKTLNLTVSEDEVETALLDVQKQNQLTREELEEAVQTQGLDFTAYRENLKQQILRYKLIGEEVRSKVDVSERDVVEYYRAHLDDYRRSPQIQLSAVTFPVSQKASAQERKKINEIVAEALVRLRQNESLEKVADSYNKTYGVTGGELGRFSYDEMFPAFVTALEGVEVGDYSEPVVASDAIQLLRVDERVPGGLRQFDAVKFEIEQKLVDQKTDARIQEWTQALKVKAFIDIRL